MATPTFNTVFQNINNQITSNGANEITGTILNSVLKSLLDFANNNIGDLSNLTTSQSNNLVEAINSISVNSGSGNEVSLHQGFSDPNTTAPSSFNTADFYLELNESDNSIIKLWQYDGFDWKEVVYGGSGTSIGFTRYKEIDDCLVFKRLNPSSLTAIEIGDVIKRYDGNRYIHAKVNALPYTSDANLSFYSESEII